MDRDKLQKVIAQNVHFTETRKASLYSNFARLHESNPDGYEANIIAWREVIEACLKQGVFAHTTCIETNSRLLTNFSDPNNGTPLSLNCVFDGMVADEILMPLDWFEKAYPGSPGNPGLLQKTTSLLSWATNYVLTPQWTSVDSEGALKRQIYVSMPAIRQHSILIINELNKLRESEGKTLASSVFNTEEIKELMNNKYSDLDLRCCLAFAKSQNQINFDQSRNVIKLAQFGPINDVDEAVAGLSSQIKELSAREKTLRKQVDNYTKEASEFIKTSRTAAKLILQKKIAAEKSYNRVVLLLNQLETVMQKINDANDNKQALAVLQSSRAVLTEMNKNTSIETVETVVEQLQNAVADTNEVISTLADLKLNESVDKQMEDMELDNELLQLEEEERSRKLVANIPKVPSHSPSVYKNEDLPALEDKQHRKEESPRNADSKMEITN